MSVATKCDQCGKLLPDDKAHSIRICGTVHMLGRTANQHAMLGEREDYLDFCNVDCMTAKVAGMKKELES